MNINQHFTQYCGLVFLTLASCVLKAEDISDDFKPYVNEKISYDNNLFLLPNNNSRLVGSFNPNAKRYDVINQVSAGLDYSYAVLQQKLNLQLNVNNNTYAYNSDLNYIGTTDSASWNWQIGKYLTGDIGYGYSRYLDIFTNLQTPIKNFVTGQAPFAKVIFAFDPSWNLIGDVNQLDTSNSNSIRTPYNRQMTTGQIGINYLTPANHSIGLKYVYSDVLFVNRAPDYISELDNHYSIQSYGTKVKWIFTSKLLLNLDLDYSLLQNSHFSNRDFQGPTWNIRLNWEMSPKLLWEVSTFRNFYPSQSSYGSYLISQGVTLQPNWKAFEKLNFKSKLSYRTDDYMGPSVGSASVTGPSSRSDTVASILTEAVYSPIEKADVSLSFTVDSRHSSIQLWTYTDYITSLNGRLRF
jgi:hypothetical protein